MIDAQQQMIPYEINPYKVSEGRNHLAVKNKLLYAADKNKAKWLVSCHCHCYSILIPSQCKTSKHLLKAKCAG